MTLTDLLHVTNRFVRWDRTAAQSCSRMFAQLAGMDSHEMAELLLDMGVRRLALELLKRQLDDETDPESLTTCPVCRTLLQNLFDGGNRQYAVRIDLKRPVIGIGAPIHFFLPRAAAILGAEAVLPEDADVANAIGAITGNVVVKRHVRIIPDQEGGFLIEGLAGARRFEKLEEADAFARDELTRMVRNQACTAGTSSRIVEVQTEDRLPIAANGRRIFMARIIRANLTGRPDLLTVHNSR